MCQYMKILWNKGEIHMKDLPNNIEAEKAVLGAMLLTNTKSNVIDDINTILKADYFYRPKHREIYKAMLELFKVNKPIDNLTLIESLNAQKQLEEVGGIAYITELSNCVPSAENVKYYADMVKSTAIRRSYIQAGEQIKELAYSCNDIDTAISKAEKIIFDISQNYIYKNDITEPTDLMIECMQELEKQYESNAGGISGVDTGYRDLNKITGGFQKSDFIILGARPAMGKTSLALSIANRVAKRKIPVAVFSLEMSKIQLAKRLASQASCINSQKISTGQLNENEWQRITKALETLSERPIYIDDSAEMNMLQLKSKARRLKREKNIQLIIIDYLQLLTSERKRDSKIQEVSDISRQLKILAKELDIPVIALAQLSRAVESRQDKRPMLSDLRESGSIEQDADIVMFLYRDEYYDKNTPNKNLTDLIIAKHRNGATGNINLFYHSDFCCFDDCLAKLK